MSLRRMLTALLLTSGLLVAAPAAAWDADFGRAWRDDGVLRPGCKDYGFRYRVRPKSHDWMLELFLVDPDGKGLGTVPKDSDIDPKRGRGTFEICRYTTRPGRFKIRGKLTIYQEGSGLPGDESTTTKKWIKPARFRLRRG